MRSRKNENIRIGALVPVFLLVMFAASCATKKYVSRNVTQPLEAHINSVDKKVDQKTSETDTRITELDRKTEQGISDAQTRADKAGQQADKAQRDAQQAQTLAQKGVNQATQLQQQVENIDNYQPVKSETILFGFDRSTLMKEEQQKLDELAQSVSSLKHYAIEVEGFTDKIGSPGYNLELSRRRAEAVVRYLTAHNVPLVKVHALGFGIESQTSAEQPGGRKKAKLSRKVEVRVLAQTTTPQAGQFQSPTEPSPTQASTDQKRPTSQQ